VTAEVRARAEVVTRPSAGWLTPARAVIALVVVVLLIAGPAVFGAYWTRVLINCMVYAIAASGIALLYGRLGLISLGQVSLLGVGGWVALRFGHATGAPFEASLLVAAAVTCVVGVLIGLPALRLSGLNLAIVTLMLAGAFEVVFTVTGFPNGGEGFLGRTAGGVLQTRLDRPTLGESDPAYFRYVLVVLVLVFLVLAAHLATRPGRGWAAIRQSEAGALASGVDTVRYRLWALALVSATTGLAGGLLAGVNGLLDPISFRASQSILLFATVLIGGAFSLTGALLAGLLSQGLPPALDELGVDGNLVFVLLGLGMVQAITTAPRGIAGQLAGLAAVRRRRRTGEARRAA
jgi:branched-chain amino acid transport system permease protein